jgi:hypothetical protein
MVKRKLLLEALRPVELAGLPLGVSALPIEIEDGKRVFIFMVTGDEQKLFVDVHLQDLAQQLGNLVHPAQAVFYVAPEGSRLEAFEVRE